MRDGDPGKYRGVEVGLGPSDWDIRMDVFHQPGMLDSPITLAEDHLGATFRRKTGSG